MSTPESSPTSSGALPDDLKRALKAFKKRLKLTRLDAESKVGHGPMSGGAGWGVTAIAPPREFPPSVWEELVQHGKLKREGQGLYSLVNP
jgi:hypothetical protein